MFCVRIVNAGPIYLCVSHESRTIVGVSNQVQYTCTMHWSCKLSRLSSVLRIKGQVMHIWLVILDKRLKYTILGHEKQEEMFLVNQILKRDHAAGHQGDLLF